MTLKCIFIEVFRLFVLSKGTHILDLVLNQEVEDTSVNRCAASFKVLVVSPQFENKPLLQRHR